MQGSRPQLSKFAKFEAKAKLGYASTVPGLPVFDKVLPEVACRACGSYNREQRVFCLNCNRRLAPSSPSVLTADDFASPGDKGALDALRGIEPIPRILNRFVTPDGRRLEAWLARNAARISPPSPLDTLVRTCGEVLGLETFPRAYVAPFAQLNAFTTGTDDSPLLVVCAPLLRKLGYAEMEALVAHELAHVRSRHVAYHSIAESLASGAGLVMSSYAGGLLTMPIRMLLLAWYRESEISADRAAALVLGECGPFESLMFKLSDQNDAVADSRGSLAELLQTHPAFERRVRLAKEFCASIEFASVRRRMEESSLGALAAICSSCGTVKPRSEAFCPHCGRSSS